jgi:hypothetical protein
MRKLIVGAAAILVLVGIAYLALFQREAIMSLFTQGKLAAQGFTPAKTPSEAMDRFLKAVKDNNYEAADMYLGGEYEEQFKKGSKGAAEMGTTIDNFRNTMKNYELKSERVKVVLGLLQAFPSNWTVGEVKQEGDDKATAVLVLEPGSTPFDINLGNEPWKIAPQMIHSLAIGLPTRVELHRDGQGDKAQWRIFFPLPPAVRVNAAYLDDHSSNFVHALDKVKEDIKGRTMTDQDLERGLREALEDVSKPS